MSEENNSTTCSDCNWFDTRNSHCNKKQKTVSPGDETCNDLWIIKRPEHIDEDQEE